MAKYYVPFVNLNTFIYEACGLEPNEYINSEPQMDSAENDVNFLTPTTDLIIDAEEIEIGEDRGGFGGYELYPETCFVFQNT